MSGARPRQPSGRGAKPGEAAAARPQRDTTGKRTSSETAVPVHTPQGAAKRGGAAGAGASSAAAVCTAAEATLPQAAFAPQAEEAALLSLLAERTARYTMGDSSSVRIETAQELLAGIAYCIDLHLRLHPEAAEAALPLPARFQAGLADVRRLLARGRLLLRQAETQPPPVVNDGYTETLAALPAFFRRYDPDFFACRIPCDIDYPLAVPIPETVQGVEYILAYLRQLLSETALLRRFPEETLRAVYAAGFSDDPGLLLNLYLPVAEAAVGCALCGRPVPALLLRPAEREGIVSSFSLLSDAEAAERLLAAAEAAARAHGLTSPAVQETLARTAEALLPRLRAAAGAQAAAGLFACTER